MSVDAISSIDRIRINLLKLKPREALEDVYRFYKKSMERYFDENGNPKQNYFEEVECPICNSHKYSHKMTIDHFKYRECDCCKSIYNSPRLKGEVLDLMYKSGEYKTYFNKLTVSSQGLRKNVIEVRKFKQISSFFDKPGRVLDVGCGTGSFLKVCQENGWDVYGLDPSDSAVRIAKEYYRLDIIQDYFEYFETDKSFDCITFWGLEHLSNPLDGVKKATNLLDRNGLIVFEGPSADSFLMKYLCKNNFVPYRYIESANHVLFFSRNSVGFICNKFNLELSYIETNGLDIQTILLYEFDNEINERIMSIQQVIDELMLGDHYRVFLKKKL